MRRRTQTPDPVLLVERKESLRWDYSEGGESAARASPRPRRSPPLSVARLSPRLPSVPTPDPVNLMKWNYGSGGA